MRRLSNVKGKISCIQIFQSYNFKKYISHFEKGGFRRILQNTSCASLSLINVFISILFACLTLNSVIFSHTALAKNNLIQLSQNQIDNLGLELGKLQPASHVPLFTAPAKVVVPPANEFVVSSAQAGLITKMNVAVGDPVKKGEVLATVNSPEWLALQGDYLKAVGSLKLASATYRRDKQLHKEGVVSGRGEQEAYSAYSTSLVEASESRQLLYIAGMSDKQIKQLESTGKLTNQMGIRSPITGRVLERMADTGTRVDALAPLYRVANLEQLWLEINLPQEQVADIQLGDKIEIENTLAEAQIQVLGQSVNPNNQTVLARANIIVNPNAVRVGQKVTIRHLQRSDSISYQVPDSAIAYHASHSYLFVKTKDGFIAQPIDVLGKQTNNSVITGQFTGDEDIALNNSAALKAVWLGLGSEE